MDASYLRQIRQDPHNDAPRLVYAEWLESRGRAQRGAWLRAERAAAANPGDAACREAFHHARAGLNPSWLLPLEQPDVLRHTGLPLEAQWWGLSLGDPRPARGAWHVWPYASLPAVLVDLATDWSFIDGGPADLPAPGELGQQLSVVQRAASEAGYTLPDSFVRLFDRFVGRRSVVRASTPAAFTLDPALWRPTEVHGGLLVPFQHDPATARSWGLWVHPSGSEAVLAFTLEFFSEGPERVSGPEVHARGGRAADLCWVSPSLTSFVYRTHVEHDIWASQHGSAEPLLMEHRTYLAHYDRGD